jgi:hypothetical protein
MSTRTTERDLWALSGMTVAATSTAANALTVHVPDAKEVATQQ